MSEARRSFLRRVRLRIRLSWLSSTAQRYVPYLGLSFVGLFGFEWLTTWDDALRFSLYLAGGFTLILLIRAATLRISDWDVSRAAERGLRARDVFTTALEFDTQDDGVHQAIQGRADRVAASATSTQAIPIHAQPERLRQLGLAAGLALLISLLPPFSSTPALSSDVEAALETEAQEVERIAEAVEKSEVENAEEIIEELQALAKELREAQTLDEALRALDDSSHRLEAKVDPQFLNQKAAVQGLARDLTLRPLVSGAPLDAASQFIELAENLNDLSDPELRALEQRLRDLAESQAAGNSALSNQLSDAARSLSAGDLAGAGIALNNAAAGQRAGLSEARGQQALAESQRALDGIASRLGSQGQGQAQGLGQGQGQGQGGGQGGQAGAGSGAIAGVRPGDGSASGQGGQGTVGSGTGEGYGTEVQTNSVYNPVDTGSVSDLLQVHIDGGSGEGAIIGRGEAPTQRGDSIVPYAQVLPEYLNEAADALSSLQLPPSMRGIVQTYFEQLADEAR